MTRIFTEKIVPEDQRTFSLQGEDAHYLADVLRMKPGGLICLCDGARTDFTGEITEISSSEVTVSLIAKVKNQTEPPYEAVLYQALVKGDKMDLIIQKGVEMGVSQIFPVSNIRSIVKIDIGNAGDAARKTARWQKIAQEAARQSGRGIVPKIEMPISFSAALQNACRTSDLVFLPWEAEKSLPLSVLLDEFASGLKTQKTPKTTAPGETVPESDTNPPALSIKPPCISFFIGPEGGFDPKEIDLAVALGIRTVTLGRRILRTETAGIAVLSMFIYRLEEM